MTVKHVNESDLQKPKKVVIQSPEVELRVNSGDLLAGKNVPKRKVTTMKYVHSQILKIREEDSHLGEDFAARPPPQQQSSRYTEKIEPNGRNQGFRIWDSKEKVWTLVKVKEKLKSKFHLWSLF
ncbi:hypothetical protein CMV_006697 [Castanea mollissima]|uniref:Uncharacterized protein n=1 Tax=Castanea mollissima TaxID=60419 RepID=A0A8J4VQZ3_9ROSI|nr:hypothetical protein CMV_006697 [Castanea mollissima]